jgi:hypothetical protein
MVVGLRSNVVMVVALRVRAVPSAACAPTLRDSMIPHIDCTQLASQQVVYHSQPHKVAHGRVMSATLLGRAPSFSRTVTAANPTTVAGGQAHSQPKQGGWRSTELSFATCTCVL